MTAPCLECKERHVACHGICDKYKEWRAWKDSVRQNEIAAKSLDSRIAAVKIEGMRRDGKQINER